jgi:subtilisin family serine protease
MVVIRPHRLVLLMLAVALVAPAAASAGTTTRIIVKRDAGLSAAEQRDIRTDAGVRLVRALELPRTELVTTSDPHDALATLRRDDDVVYAQIDHKRHITADDPRMARQWGLRNIGQSVADVFYGGLFDADIDAPEAWAQTIPGDGDQPVAVTGAGQEVAVVDTGVDDRIADLSSQVAAKRDFIGGAPGTPDTATDDNGHGTHVTGILVAARDDEGIVGVAPGAEVMALKALGPNGQGFDSDIADAMRYAGEQGIRVVNLSLGGSDAAPALEDAIRTEDHTLFVTAAGNEGANNDSSPSWPCNAAEPNVICVGASTNRDDVAPFSNYGHQNVDLFAPGDAILSTVPIGTFANTVYAYKSGTSMAAPHVAAAAALIMQVDPSMTLQRVKDVILATVDHRPAFADTSVSGGRLNVGAAVAVAINDPGVPTDEDADTVIDAIDSCLGDPGAGTDGCAVRDTDHDGIADPADNCPSTINADQTDDDHDDYGNVCDDTPRGADTDGDGRAAVDDNCPTVPNADQANLDHDKLGDACDADVDGDGRANGPDNCDRTYNPTQANLDGDAMGDACDPDDDNDFRIDAPAGPDVCPRVKAFTPNGCPAVVKPPPKPADSDKDGILDTSDACRFEYAKTANGCPLPAVTALSTRVKKRSATISVRASRDAIVQVTIQRRKCQHGKCRWVRVTRRTTATVAAQATVTVRRLKRGKYRAVVVLSSAAGRAAAETHRFRVR